MKFFIVLVILLVGEQTPRVLTYQYDTFSEIETCDMYINTSKNYLKQTIERQFPVKTIQQSAIACMTKQEIENILTAIEENKWQEQKHI